MGGTNALYLLEHDPGFGFHVLVTPSQLVLAFPIKWKPVLHTIVQLSPFEDVFTQLDLPPYFSVIMLQVPMQENM